MLVIGHLVSKKRDNKTWCRPSEGSVVYNDIVVELRDYVEIDTVQGELPESDMSYPEGASIDGHIKVGDMICIKRIHLQFVL